MPLFFCYFYLQDIHLSPDRITCNHFESWQGLLSYSRLIYSLQSPKTYLQVSVDCSLIKCIAKNENKLLKADYYSYGRRLASVHVRELEIPWAWHSLPRTSTAFNPAPTLSRIQLPLVMLHNFGHSNPHNAQARQPICNM